MSLQKPTRWRVKKYTDWVKTQPCIKCGRPAEPHHMKGVGNMSGGGLKAPDWATMPLCHPCHDEMQRTPEMWPDQWEYALRTVGEAITSGFFKL